jgi:phosphopantothenoylcysteine synthetase/decarboxylase
MKFLITAGPTREPLDPVRYLTNRSSGRMGYALAEAALELGHAVTLISGPVTLTAPVAAELLPVETAAEMYAAVQAHIHEAEAAIFCAAVADYTPAEVAEHKIKKSADVLELRLVRTADILGSVRNVFGFKGQLCGFAAETRDLAINAQDKLRRKGCDLLVGNDVSVPGVGFESTENEITLFYADGRVRALPRGTKLELAREIIRVMEGLT